jgi:hypothetical protein
MKYELLGVIFGIRVCFLKYAESSADNMFSVRKKYSLEFGKIFISPAKIYGISDDKDNIRFNASI